MAQGYNFSSDAAYYDELAAQEEANRIAAEEAAARLQAEQAMRYAASTIAAASTPTQQVTDTTTPVATPKLGDAFDSSVFAQKFLPTQETFKWVRNKQDFIDLPTEQRARLVDESLAQRRTAEGWDDAKYLATKQAAHKALTYMDTGGAAPKAEWLNNDLVDKAWTGLRGLGYAAQRYFTDASGAAALDVQESIAKQNDQLTLSANTKDVDRRAAFRQKQAEQLGNKNSLGDKAWGGFQDLAAAPAAAMGSVLGAALPTVAVAAATGGASAPVQLASLTATGALQNVIQAPSDRYQSYMQLSPDVFKGDTNFAAMKARGASDSQAQSFAAAKLAYGAASSAVDAAIGGTAGFIGAKMGGAALLQGRGSLLKAAGVDQLQNAAQTGATSIQKDVMGQSVNPMGMGEMLGGAAADVAGGIAPTLLGTAGFKLGSMAGSAVKSLKNRSVEPLMTPESVNEQIVRRATVDANSPDAAALAAAMMEPASTRTAEQVALVDAATRVAEGKPEAVNPEVISSIDPVVKQPITESLLLPEPVRSMAESAAPAPQAQPDTLSVPAAPPPSGAVAKANAMKDLFMAGDKPAPIKVPERFWTAQDVLAYSTKDTPPEAVAQIKSAFQADLSSDIHTKGLSAADVSALGVRLVSGTDKSPVASLLTEAQVRKSIKDNINAILVEGQTQNVTGTTVPRIRVNGNEITFNFENRPSLIYPDKNAAIRALATDQSLQSFLPKQVFVAQSEAAAAALAKADARAAAMPASEHLVDTYFAYDKNRDTEGAVGSAILNADTTASATFIAPDGKVLTASNLPNMETAKQWLQDKGAGVVINKEQKNSGQQANINAAAQTAAQAVNSAEPFVAGTKAMFVAAKVAGLTDAGASVVATRLVSPFRKLLSRATWRELYAEYGSRYSPMDALKQGAVAAGRADLARTVGEDAAIRARNKANSELTTSGMTDPTVHDITNDIIGVTQRMSKDGIGSGIIETMVYARTAKERNKVVEAKYPTDLRGEITDGNGSGFAYYRDKTTKKILDVQAGNVDIGTEAAPANSERVSGKTAPQEFLTQFAMQFPNHIQSSLDLANHVASINSRVLSIEQSAGLKSSKDVASDKKHEHYTPLVQLENTKSSYGNKAATGRSTAAVSPLTQLLAQVERRVAKAYSHSVIRDMAAFAQELPMPDFMTLNSYDAKLRPADAGSQESNIAWASDHGLNKDNVFKTYVGENLYTLTIHDKTIASNLLAPEFSQVHREYTIPILAGLNRATSLTRTTLVPGQWVVGAAWDTGLALFNLQGGVGKNLATGEWVVKTKDVLPMYKRIMQGAIADMPSTASNEFRKVTGGADTAEASANVSALRYFAEQGGGISLHAATGVDMGGLDPLTGKPSMARAGLNNLAHGIDTVGTVGHIVPSAIRFNAFKEVVKQYNGGVLPKDAAAWKAFNDSNPYIVDAAIRGSKEILGNFEAIGHSVIMRGMFPFFNASMVGAFRVMPQIIKSPAGLSSVAAVMGLAATTAMMQMGKEKDVDGMDQYTRKAGVWDNGLAMGGVTIPLPHEMRVFANIATWAAAQSYRMAGGSIDIAHVNAKMLRSFVDLLPGLKTAPFDNAPLTSALGHLGFPLSTAVNMDATGREFGALKSNGTYDYSIDEQKFNQMGATGVAPDWTKYNSSNSNLQISTAKALANLPLMPLDITPDAVQNLQRYVFGSWYRYEDTYNKTLLDSGGDHSLASRELVAAVFKPFWNEANKNAVRDTYQMRVRNAENEAYKASPDAATGSRKTALTNTLADAAKEISGIKSSAGQTRAELDRYMSLYKAKGDMLGYAAAKKQMLEIDQSANIVRARVTNMLEN
jgi:hypothetical protein